MSNYIFGILLTLVVIAFHSWSNIFDNYLSGKIFSRLSNLIFFACLTNLLFIPFCFLIETPQFISHQALFIVILISLINVFYHYPYYWALQKTDTSIVASLFSLGKIFTPILAFLFLNEHLKNIQYCGFFLLILSSVLLTLDIKKIRFNTAFFLMLIVSIIVSVQVILYKLLFDIEISWSSSVFWTGIFDFVISIPIIFHPKNFNDLKTAYLKVKEIRWLFLLNQFLSWTGEAFSMYALFYIPASVFEGITSTQPIFVLLFAILFAPKIRLNFQ